MALTPITLVFLGALALLATLGLFYEFDDPYTGILVGFLGAVLWGLFALGSMDVMLYDAPPADAAGSMDVLMWAGVGLALLTALFAVNDLFHALGSEARDTSASDIARQR